MTESSGEFKVIVNADDFGMARSTTDHIVAGIDAGQITSTTVMANGPDLERALNLAADRPSASFGVHLNLTQFSPLTSDDRLAPLLHEGQFHRASRWAAGSPAVRSALVEELSAQVRTVAAAVPVSHLDSHHMVHWRPELMSVVKAVARTTEVPRVRTAEIWAPMPVAARTLRRLWKRAMSRGPTLSQTDEFQALATFVRVADSLPASVSWVELMVHPGHPDYQAETALLQGDWQARVARPISLVTFNELGA